MPTYEYQCTKCGHKFDELQSIKDEPLTLCPNCGENALKRIMGAGAGMIFKGSGFYLTDYKKSGSSPKSGSRKTKTDTTPPKDTTPPVSSVSDKKS